MKIKAVRLYGKNDLRLEEFELPAIKDNEILAKVVCDSLCMSSYKALKQGTEHKRIPLDIAINPIIIGHEFSGEIISVGKKWKNKYEIGMKFSIQPALNFKDGPVGLYSAPGYSYRYIGGDMTYIVIPDEVMENACLLPYMGRGFFPAALAEPFSCVIAALHSNYHSVPGSYNHIQDIVNCGKMAILGGAGPMGMAAINYVLNRKGNKPELLVVTDINQHRLDRTASLYSPSYAAKLSIDLKYINTSEYASIKKTAIRNTINNLLFLTGGQGYDDVFVFAPFSEIINIADNILAQDGCLNFFAGPDNPDFTAEINFYNIHYNRVHIVGTSGGNNDDMNEALELFSESLNPASIVTHIGGLDAVIETTKNLPHLPGGKKLIYTGIDLELTALADLEEKALINPLFRTLAEITKTNNNLWSVEAEEFLLKHF